MGNRDSFTPGDCGKPHLIGGWLSPVLATALAATLVLGVVGSRLAPSGWPTGESLALHRDSVLTVAIRDTLALVRFSLIAPRAARVEWAAQVALAPGRHRYAFAVDDTQWVADSAAPAALAPDGRPASRVVVPNQD